MGVNEEVGKVGVIVSTVLGKEGEDQGKSE